MTDTLGIAGLAQRPLLETRVSIPAGFLTLARMLDPADPVGAASFFALGVVPGQPTQPMPHTFPESPRFVCGLAPIPLHSIYPSQLRPTWIFSSTPCSQNKVPVS